MRFGELAGQVVDAGLLVLEFGLVLVLEGGDLEKEDLLDLVDVDNRRSRDQHRSTEKGEPPAQECSSKRMLWEAPRTTSRYDVWIYMPLGSGRRR